METTLIILKPDAIQRRLAGRILARFEDKGLNVIGLKMARLARATAEEHYAVHRDKPFYDGLVRYITSNPVIIAAVRGLHAIEVCRRLLGKTFGYEAEPGTIRGDFGNSKSMNLVHASDSPESARKELALFFESYELFDSERADLEWVYDPEEELGR
ncbi:MAG: nucleoside-diphosphate kinase [Planctomycetota bacterium]|jgi:nucleoside-diphosphate kinase